MKCHPRSSILFVLFYVWGSVVASRAPATPAPNLSGRPNDLGAHAGAGRVEQTGLRSAAKPSETKENQKKGTAVVPPGVKLEPAMPAGGHTKPFHFPVVASRRLSNGLRVFVATDHREPAITVRLVLTSAGTIHDPPGVPGVASMTAALLTQGTEKRSAQQVAEAIDLVGGSLSASADSDATAATVSVVKKDFDLGMDLLSDVVLHPALKSEELERQRQRLLSGLEASYADANYLASAAFNRVVYGASPYGLPDVGTPDSVRKLDRNTLVRFHGATYVPNHALLAFAGDIAPEVAFAAAEKYFGAWKQKEIAATEMAAPSMTHGLRILLIDKPDAVQTQIRAGRLGIPRNSPDYIPLYVTNRIFGGGYNSRLNTEVRVRKGLTYGARSVFDSHRLSGAFLAETFTRTEATVEATKLVVDLIAKMSTGEVTPAELNFAKDYLAGVYPIQTETAAQVAGRVLTVAEYSLPENYNDTYQQRILGVTSDQAKAMGERYFNAQDLDLVLVGNAARFRDDLKKAFPDAKWEEIPADQLDLLKPDLRRPKEVTPAATSESLERGRAILAAAAEAAGGTELTAVQSLDVRLAGNVFAQGQEIPVELGVQIAYPDRVRIETKLPFGTIQQGFDGKAGWLASPQGTMDAPPSFNGEFQRGIALAGGWGLYQQALAGRIEAQFLGEEEVEGKKTETVQWNAPFGPVKLYFDPATHLLVGAHFRGVTPQGSAETDQRWSDFRKIEGRQFPFHVVTNREGAKFSDTTVQELKVNTKPDASIFAKPQTPTPK